MKKRIVHIVQSPGGVERYIQMFLKYIDRSRFENILICSFEYNKKNYEGKVDGFYHVLMKREINFLIDIRAIHKVRKLLKSIKPDIIYCHSSKAGVIGRIADIGINNRVIYNPHGWSFAMKKCSFTLYVYRFVERILAKVTDDIIAISECEKEKAIEGNICNEDKIKIIKNGIDTNECHTMKIISKDLIKEKWGIPRDSYVIGTVGRICEQKASDLFIDFAKELYSKIPNVYFLLIGDGPMRSQCEESIIRFGIDKRVIITGWVSDAKLLLNILDQGIFLTRWEGFGLVLAEYMLEKVPIVATNVDSVKELIYDGENGLLVEVDDVKQIVEASLNLFNDRNLVEKLIENGLRIVKRDFDVKRTVSEHEFFFMN